MAKKLAPVHPGEVLAEDFMAPIGLTANQLARSLRISANRVTAIIPASAGLPTTRPSVYPAISALEPRCGWVFRQMKTCQSEGDLYGAEIQRALLRPA